MPGRMMLTVLADKGGNNRVIGDTVDAVTTETQGQTAGSEGDSAWARPGTPEVASAYQQPGSVPYPVQAPVAVPPIHMGQQPLQTIPKRNSSNRLIVGMILLAALLSVAAIALSAINVGRHGDADITTTVTAGPPVYTDDQVAAAKKDACDASLTIDDPLIAAQRALVAIPDRNSPEAQEALSKFQMVVMVETEYLKTRTRPETPESVKSAVAGYVSALLAEVDAETRQLADGEVNIRIRATKANGQTLAQACK